MKNKTTKWPALIIALAAFCVLLIVPVFDDTKAQRCFALLVMVAILWMTEAIPLSLTGLLIPVFAILLQLSPPKQSFSEFAHPVIFLFMGGFVLAGALSRHSLDKLLAQKLTRLA